MSLQYTCLNLLYVIKQSIHNVNAFILMSSLFTGGILLIIYVKMNFFITFIIIL